MSLNYTTSTALTITAGSLASGAARSSAAVTPGTNNTSAIFLSVNALMTTTQTTGDQRIVVYGYMSEDGSTYTGASSAVDNVDGTDKTLTALGVPTNLKYIGAISTNNGTGAITLHDQFEITQAFGCIPRQWGIVLYNDCGTALGATVTASYTEAYYT